MFFTIIDIDFLKQKVRIPHIIFLKLDYMKAIILPSVEGSVEDKVILAPDSWGSESERNALAYIIDRFTNDYSDAGWEGLEKILKKAGFRVAEAESGPYWDSAEA